MANTILEEEMMEDGEMDFHKYIFENMMYSFYQQYRNHNSQLGLGGTGLSPMPRLKKKDKGSSLITSTERFTSDNQLQDTLDRHSTLKKFKTYKPLN